MLLRFQDKDSEQNEEEWNFGAENYIHDPASDYFQQYTKPWKFWETSILR